MDLLVPMVLKVLLVLRETMVLLVLLALLDLAIVLFPTFQVMVAFT